MEKYQIEYYIAGTFFQESEVKNIESKDIDKLKLPPYVFGFEITTKIKNENERLKTVKKEVYMIGKVLTLDDVSKIYGKETAAYRNVVAFMRNDKNLIPFIGAPGNLQVINKNDTVLDPHKMPNLNQNTLANYDEKLSKLVPSINRR